MNECEPMDYTIDNKARINTVDLIASIQAQVEITGSVFITGQDLATFIDLAIE